MTDEVFQQNLEEKDRPGGPFFIQLLFKEPAPRPDKELMTEVIKRRCDDAAECFCYDEEMVGFAAWNHMAEFKDDTVPVQLWVMPCTEFDAAVIDPFLRSQMWNCKEDRDRILEACRYQVLALDMMTSALPIDRRAELDMDFMEALAELYPTCEAFYFTGCGKLFPAREIREHSIPREDRFIKFGVNVRFFNIEGGDSMLIDTLGLSKLFLPDLQYHFHGMEPDWVVNHAYNMAAYILKNDNPIKPGDTIDGIAEGRFCQELQWKCHYEDALVQPAREVVDINMGQYASGGRPD